MADFYDWLAHYAERRPGHTAAHDLASKRGHSYAALHARTDALARHLQENLQIQPEDRVGVLCHNTTDIFEMQFACWRIGDTTELTSEGSAIVVLLNRDAPGRYAIPEAGRQAFVHEDGAVDDR